MHWFTFPVPAMAKTKSSQAKTFTWVTGTQLTGPALLHHNCIGGKLELGAGTRTQA